MSLVTPLPRPCSACDRIATMECERCTQPFCDECADRWFYLCPACDSGEIAQKVEQSMPFTRVKKVQP